MNAKTFFSALQSWKLQVLACLLIALCIRLPSWGSIPAGLNRDEAALGYNAYSLLKNGTDEYGTSWPVTFRSFGDEKLPGYIYTLIPFVQIFGLTIEAVKLPSLLAGLVIIVSMGVIARELAKEYTATWQRWLPGFTMLFVAVSPWGNHFSRVAYESHLALSFFLSGVAALLLSRKSAHIQQRWLLIGSATAFSLALVTYHSYQLFLPLFLVSIAFILRKELPQFDRVGVGTGVAIGLLTGLVLLVGGVWSANLTKQTGISPFSQKTISNTMWQWRQAVPSLPGKILSNRATEPSIIFLRNYLRTFSPEFFFISGSDHHVHNVTGIGNLHPFLAPLVVIGFFWAFRTAKKPLHQVLLAWFFLALIPSSLTITPTHTVRAAASFPALELLAALGLTALLNATKRPPLVLTGFLAVLSFSVARMETQYLKIAPPLDQAYSHESYHLLARALEKYAPQADAVLTQSPSSSPYIWYLFETGMSPQQLITSRENYPSDEEHFIHTKRVGNIFFTTLQWPEVEARAQGEALFLVLKPTEFPGEKRSDERYTFVESIADRFGTTVYEVWKIGS